MTNSNNAPGQSGLSDFGATDAQRSREIVGTANTGTPPIIHARVRPGVPPLTYALTDRRAIDPAHIVFDRLAYHLELPISFQSEDALSYFIELIGDPAVQDFWSGGRTRRQPKEGAGRIKFRIADGWHVTGDAELRLGRHRSGFLVLDLDINYSRWAGQLLECDPAIISAVPAAELLVQRQRSSRGALDGNDNMLPFRNRLGSPSAEPRVLQANELVAIYLAKVEELLDYFLIGRPDFPMPAGMSLTAPTLRGASYVEAYSEFHSDDAIADVERMRRAAIAGMSNPTWQHFRAVRGGVERNSTSVNVPLTKTVGLTIYAKSPTTLRTEVRYYDNIREHAFHRRDRGRVVSPAAELIGLKHDAADRIRNALAAFAANLSAADTYRDPTTLLHAVYLAVEHDVHRARSLYSALTNLGGISVTDEDGIAPPAVVQRLEQAGIVRQVPYRHGNANHASERRFSLTATFSDHRQNAP